MKHTISRILLVTSLVIIPLAAASAAVKEAPPPAKYFEVADNALADEPRETTKMLVIDQSDKLARLDATLDKVENVLIAVGVVVAGVTAFLAKVHGQTAINSERLHEQGNRINDVALAAPPPVSEPAPPFASIKEQLGKPGPGRAI